MQVLADGWLTVSQASTSSGYNEEYIRQLVRRGQVACQRVSRMIYVSQHSLEQYKRDTGSAMTTRPGQKRDAHKLGAQLTKDRYLTDSQVRQVRNDSVASFLDGLAHVSTEVARDQKATGEKLQRALRTNRLKLRNHAG
jgi:hypothetical protein